MPGPSDVSLFIALTLAGAVLLVLQVSLAWFLLRSSRMNLALRWLGVLPPLTPLAAFAAGARVRAVLWCVVAAAYLVLRTRA